MALVTRRKQPDMGGMWYCTREMVARAADAGESAREIEQIDRLIEASSRFIDALCVRPRGAFLPITATRTFDWPSFRQTGISTIRLDSQPLVSVTAFTSGGTMIAASDYLLRPDDGPPYTEVQIDLSSTASLATGDTAQRSVSLTGVWSVAPPDDRPAGALAGAISSTSATTLDLTAAGAAALGVGSVLLIDSERLIAQGRRAVDTTVDTAGTLDESPVDRALAVADGTAFAVGETLLIDSERVRVDDVAGNTLIVARAVDGSALATHAPGADIYAYRRLTVERGALGTTAATHLTGATVTRHQVPADVEQLAIGRALVALMQETAGYGSTSGPEGAARSTAAAGLPFLTKSVHQRYARKMRHRAV